MIPLCKAFAGLRASTVGVALGCKPASRKYFLHRFVLLCRVIKQYCGGCTIRGTPRCISGLVCLPAIGTLLHSPAHNFGGRTVNFPDFPENIAKSWKSISSYRFCAKFCRTLNK